MDVGRLHKQIDAVVPIVGVSIGNANDKSTWRVHYKSPPTQEQINSVLAIIQGYNVDAIVPSIDLREALLLLVDNIGVFADADLIQKQKLLSSLRDENVRII